MHMRKTICFNIKYFPSKKSFQLKSYEENKLFTYFQVDEEF